MRPDLAALDGAHYDVAVIGAGINGAASARELAAAGYKVMLVDRGDFGSGASGRSSRMLHCGLRYLATGVSAADMLRHPQRLWAGLRQAREALAARTDFVRATPDRARKFTFCMPIWRDAVYPGWQIDLAFLTLKALAGGDSEKLGYRRVSSDAAQTMPLLSALRDPDKLASVATFREYAFDWPERICVDAALDVGQMGGAARNYTEVVALDRVGGHWSLVLRDAEDSDQTATVEAAVVLNMTGMWIDQVNGRIGGDTKAGRKVVGMKGAHILVRLPPECADYGLLTMNRAGGPFFCMPAPGGLHYFGLTDARFGDDDDLNDVRVTPAEIEFLVAEASHVLPGLGLKRGDVLASWAGVAPYTFDPALPKGKRSRDLHDLSGEGLPNLFALTGGSVRTHRFVAADMVHAVGRKLAPSAPPPPEPVRAAADAGQVSPLSNTDPAIDPVQLRQAAAEDVVTLADLLFRRVELGWAGLNDEALPQKAAAIAGDVLGWDAARREAEIRRYRAYVATQFAPRPN